MLRSKLLHATALNSHWEMFHLLFELSLNVGHQLLFLSLLSLHVTQHCKWKIHKTGAICLQHFMYIAQLHTEGYCLQHFMYIAQLHTEGYCLKHFMYIAQLHTEGYCLQHFMYIAQLHTEGYCLQHFMYIAQLHTEGYSLQHFIYIAQLHTEGYCLQHFMYIARSHTVHAASTGSLFCTLTLSATNRAFTEHLSQEIEGGVWVRAWVCMW